MVGGMGDRTSLPTLGGECVPGTSFTAPFYDDEKEAHSDNTATPPLW